LRAGCRLLTPEDKAIIAGFIEAGPQWEASPDNVERWKLGQLARFGDQLPDELRATYDALVERHGQPTEEDDPFEFADWPATHSPVGAAAIAELSDEELLTLLRTWRAPGGWRAPTVDGLRNQVEEAVAANPARFAALSPRFIDLAPDYGAAVLVALTRVLSADRPNPPGDGAPQNDDTSSAGAEPFAWDDVLDFAQAVIDTSRSQNDQPPQADVYGPTWHGCRRHVAELLTAAMQRQRIDTSRAGRVLALILELVEDQSNGLGNARSSSATIPSPKLSTLCEDWLSSPLCTSSCGCLATTAPQQRRRLRSRMSRVCFTPTWTPPWMTVTPCAASMVRTSAYSPPVLGSGRTHTVR
jgi:hypothetical protein